MATLSLATFTSRAGQMATAKSCELHLPVAVLEAREKSANGTVNFVNHVAAVLASAGGTSAARSAARTGSARRAKAMGQWQPSLSRPLPPCRRARGKGDGCERNQVNFVSFIVAAVLASAGGTSAGRSAARTGAASYKGKRDGAMAAVFFFATFTSPVAAFEVKAKDANVTVNFVNFRTAFRPYVRRKCSPRGSSGVPPYCADRTSRSPGSDYLIRRIDPARKRPEALPLTRIPGACGVRIA